MRAINKTLSLLAIQTQQLRKHASSCYRTLFRHDELQAASAQESLASAIHTAAQNQQHSLQSDQAYTSDPNLAIANPDSSCYRTLFRDNELQAASAQESFASAIHTVAQINNIHSNQTVKTYYFRSKSSNCGITAAAVTATAPRRPLASATNVLYPPREA